MKFTRWLLIVLLSMPVLAGKLSLQEQYNNFTMEQKQVLQRAYEIGFPFNMGWTMAAIAWQESYAGVYKLNMQDPSAGVFHNNLRTVLARHEIEYNSFNVNRMAQRLVDDIDFSGAEALSELEFWKSVHGHNSWLAIWTSYNGGYNFRKPDSDGYARASKYGHEIYQKVKFLRELDINSALVPETGWILWPPRVEDDKTIETGTISRIVGKSN